MPSSLLGSYTMATTSGVPCFALFHPSGANSSLNGILAAILNPFLSYIFVRYPSKLSSFVPPWFTASCRILSATPLTFDVGSLNTPLMSPSFETNPYPPSTLITLPFFAALNLTESTLQYCVGSEAFVFSSSDTNFSGDALRCLIIC